MDEFVRRPVKRPLTNSSRNIPRRPTLAVDAGMPVVKATPSKESESPIHSVNKGNKRRFSFKLPTPKSKKQWIIFTIVAVILLSGAGFAVYWFIVRDTSTPVTNVASEPQPEPEPEPTTGQSVVSGREVPISKVKQPIYSVQIENSPEARPQSGLVDADIVTEAIAEGGITRFNAIYHDNVPANIGPVRSMRPYFIDWFLPYNAAAAHAGGSPEALNDLVNLKVQDMNHDSTHYRRVTSRYAPHNLYTTGTQMLDYFKSRGYSNGDFTSLTRKPLESDEEEPPETETTTETTKDTTATTPTASKINLNISSPLYSVIFTWDKATNTYPRTMGGVAHKDADSGKRISPSVVVVPVVARTPHPDRVHNKYATVGSGILWVFQDGEVIKGTWKKTSRAAQWQLLDAKNKPIQLNGGQTWFTIIESADRVGITP